MMQKRELELLAPAGSYETFEAVIRAGADAVYLGGSHFGARAYANNFNEEELLRAIDYAHIHGRQVYLTVNTLFKEEELEQGLYEYLLPYYEQGLDAVIVQDMGAFARIRSMFPRMDIHTSTQGDVSGYASSCQHADDCDRRGGCGVHEAARCEPGGHGAGDVVCRDKRNP